MMDDATVPKKTVLTSARGHCVSEYTDQGGNICHLSHRSERLWFLASKLSNTDALSSIDECTVGTSTASLRATKLECTWSTSSVVGTTVYRRVSPVVKGPPFLPEVSLSVGAAVVAAAYVCSGVGFSTNISQARGSELNMASVFRVSFMPWAGSRVRQRRVAHSASVSLHC